ncbi:MAG: hypothetical protein AAGE94_18360 [Acidobacteriota bacterium]
MTHRTTSGQGTHRVFLVVASLIIGSCVWFFLLDSDELVAQEAPATDSTRTPFPPDPLAARVGDRAITERELRDAIADQLAETEQRLLAEALEQRIQTVLLDAEAAARGIDRATLLAEEVDARLDRVSDAAVADALAVAGLDATAEVERQIRRKLRLEAFCAELERRADVDRYARGIAHRRAALATRSAAASAG